MGEGSCTACSPAVTNPGSLGQLSRPYCRLYIAVRPLPAREKCDACVRSSTVPPTQQQCFHACDTSSLRVTQREHMPCGQSMIGL